MTASPEPNDRNPAQSEAVPRQGILAALWLPTDANGNLLVRELAQNLAFLKASGIHGVLALGSTGEFPQLDLEQRMHALATVAELAAPLPVVANVSDIRLTVVAALARLSRQLDLPAIAIMPPGFYPSNQDDLLAHFLHAAESSGLPTFLYNFPELTGTRINLDTVAAFAARARLAGVKQSGGEFEYHRALVQLAREKEFVVFTGADTRLPEAFEMGVAGCIGGLANIVPELMVDVYHICAEQAPGDARIAADKLKTVGRIIDRLTFPLNVAAGVEARGLAAGLPKALVSARSREIYRGIVTELGEKFAEWNLGPVGSTRT